MNYSEKAQGILVWWYRIKPSNWWPMVFILGLFLLLVDLFGTLAFVRGLPGLTNSLQVPSLGITLIATSIALLSTAMQVTFWHAQVQGKKPNIIDTVFFILLICLNVLAGMAVLVNGGYELSRVHLDNALQQAFSDGVGILILVTFTIIAVTLSILPDYLVVLAIKMRQELHQD